MKTLRTLWMCGWLCSLTTPLAAQFGDAAPSSGPVFGAERTQRWKIGMQVLAQTPCYDVFVTIPVPTNWPEQDVAVVDEQLPDAVAQVRYRDLDGGVRQMLVSMPELNVGAQVETYVTVEVTRRTVSPPADTSEYRIPTRLPRELRKYLASSPMIDCRNRKIRDVAKTVTEQHDTAWEKVEALHDWVQENIEHSNVAAKGAVAALQAKQGHMEDLTGLFIALCRAAKIPARTVWVPDYSYAEFYLEDQSGTGFWFPCELKEKTTFGVVPNDYMILQKGDSIDVPEKKEPQRFVREFITGTGKPRVTFVRQVLPAG